MQRYVSKPLLHPPCNYSVHKQQCHYNAPQPRVQVVDHSFSGYACMTYRGDAIKDFNFMWTLAVTKHTSALIFSNLIPLT